MPETRSERQWVGACPRKPAAGPADTGSVWQPPGPSHGKDIANKKWTSPLSRIGSNFSRTLRHLLPIEIPLSWYRRRASHKEEIPGVFLGCILSAVTNCESI